MTKFKKIAASLLMVGALFTTASLSATPAQADPRIHFSVNLGTPVYTAPAPVYTTPGYIGYPNALQQGWVNGAGYANYPIQYLDPYDSTPVVYPADTAPVVNVYGGRDWNRSREWNRHHGHYDHRDGYGRR
jgi:hypothetical protein